MERFGERNVKGLVLHWVLSLAGHVCWPEVGILLSLWDMWF